MRATELDGEPHVDVRALDLDHLEKKPSPTVDVLGRPQDHTLGDHLLADQVQQFCRQPRLHPRHHQLRQALVVQADGVCERALITLDELN
ncbi:MAG: hypothetical protein U1C73_11550 [Dietzia sp.]|nr:hypothetical protein [Dietzia sp.]